MTQEWLTTDRFLLEDLGEPLRLAHVLHASRPTWHHFHYLRTLGAE